MTTVGRTDASHIEVGTVRVGRIAVVVVLRNHVVVALTARQRELALAMSYPQAQLGTTERTEHHTLVLRNLKGDEGTLELVRVVVEHAGRRLKIED